MFIRFLQKTQMKVKAEREFAVSSITPDRVVITLSDSDNTVELLLAPETAWWLARNILGALGEQADLFDEEYLIKALLTPPTERVAEGA